VSRRKLRHGQGGGGGSRSYETRKRHENHGDCGSLHGLPLSVSTHAANPHEVSLVQLCFDFYRIEAKPENLYQSSVSLTRWGFPNQLQNDSRWRTEGRLPWGLPLRCGGTIPAGSFVAWRRE